MYEAAGVPDLWELVGRVSGHVDRLRRLHLPTAGKTEAILRDHRAIARAIDAKDPAAAQAALRKHLSGTLSAVDEICRQYPDYVAA
jgi:DNA-binding GntR family transcriptional regulator